MGMWGTLGSGVFLLGILKIRTIKTWMVLMECKFGLNHETCPSMSVSMKLLPLHEFQTLLMNGTSARS